jgi:Family of unknown function (DUF6404)
LLKKSKKDIQAYIRQLENQGIKSQTAVPPLFRLMWSLGVNMRPPLNQSFLVNTLFNGFFFGTFWGLLMWFIQWRKWHLSVISAIIYSSLAGVFFGAVIALYYLWKRRRVKVPTW